MDWKSDFVSANDIRIHYHRTGGEKPALVLLHGITDNGLCWSALARELASEFDVVMLDSRGHGLSDAPETGYAYTNLAGDIAGVIHQLGLGKVRLLGHSMGAGTAALAAADHSELIHSLLLEDPPWRPWIFGNSEEERQQKSEEWRRNSAEKEVLGLEGIIAQGRTNCPGWKDEEFGPWAESKLQVNPAAFDLVKESHAPWQETASRIRCPVLLITGDPGRGALITARIAREAEALIPKCQVTHIPGAGHCIRRDQPEEYLRVVKDFLSCAVTQQ